jgi:predicted permease
LTADVVTLTADNYFPPSGESSGGPERFMSLLIPVIILLITCTNASALLTGLGLARRHEIAVRLALGAPRRRIVRQLVTESVLLALTAAALAAGVIAILLRIFEASIPDIQPVLTWRVTTFSFGLALLTGILFGTSPAVHATRVGVSDVLKDAGAVVARRSRLQAGLVVAQIALTQPALLAMGTLILEMVADYREIPSSLFADRIMEVRFNTNPRYGSMDQNREAALRTLQARLAALPGVVGVTPQGTHHLDVLARDDVFEIAVHPADRAAGVGESGVLNNTLPLRVHVAPPGYFPLRGIPVVRGRDFDSAGRDEAGTVIIGAELARQLWGTADPIGRRFTSTGLHSRRAGTFSVTGVVDEARSGLRSGPTDDYRIFVPDVQITGHFLLRTEGPAQPMIPTVRAVANSEAPVVPVIGVTTLDAIEASQRRSVLRTIAAIVGAGALALSLSAIGLYATVAFAVGQRAREIGARAALGATRTQIVWAFLSRGLRLSLIGLIIGLTLSIVVTRLITAVQGQEAPAGLLALAAVVAFVELGVALVATWIAARRAALVDPLEALRMG